MMPDLESLVKLGQRMRAAQRSFFKTKSRDDLALSKKLEKEFDAAAESALAGAGPLFSDPAPAEEKLDECMVSDLPKHPVFIQTARGMIVTDALHQPKGAIVIGGGMRRAKVTFDGRTWRVAEMLT